MPSTHYGKKYSCSLLRVFTFLSQVLDECVDATSLDYESILTKYIRVHSACAKLMQCCRCYRCSYRNCTSGLRSGSAAAAHPAAQSASPINDACEENNTGRFVRARRAEEWTFQ